jgi:hypothetical protein
MGYVRIVFWELRVIPSPATPPRRNKEVGILPNQRAYGERIVNNWLLMSMSFFWVFLPLLSS